MCKIRYNDVVGVSVLNGLFVFDHGCTYDERVLSTALPAWFNHLRSNLQLTAGFLETVEAGAALVIVGARFSASNTRLPELGNNILQEKIKNKLTHRK